MGNRLCDFVTAEKNKFNSKKNLFGKDILTGKLIDKRIVYYGLAIITSHESAEKALQTVP